MRMEDLDRGRVRTAYYEAQLADLRWLGLDWEEGPDVGGEAGPYLQSERTALYDQALRRMDEAGLLYPCHCTRKEIAAAASAPHADDEEGPAYPGTCAEHPPDGAERRDAALRFRVPPEDVEFYDLVYGVQRFTPSLETGDFVVRRKDGVPAYQLAVVVDDAAMSITDVLRGADLLASTARQILLYRALGLTIPRWAHVPLLTTADGDRFSKRSNALSLRELREGGINPERVVGWLAATCGLNPGGEERSAAELIAGFDLERLPREDTAVELPDWAGRRMSP